MNTIKNSLLALAGAATLAVAGTASAMTPPYAMCSLKGETTLSGTTGTATCWTTLTAKIDCAGNIEIVAAGPVPGMGTCHGLYVGNFPWTGNAAPIIAGTGSINTDPFGLGLPAVIAYPPGVVAASGVLSPVGPATAMTAVCDGGGTTVTVPDVVTIHGTFTNGATFDTTTLDNKGCVLVP